MIYRLGHLIIVQCRPPETVIHSAKYFDYSSFQYVSVWLQGTQGSLLTDKYSHWSHQRFVCSLPTAMHCTSCDIWRLTPSVGSGGLNCEKLWSAHSWVFSFFIFVCIQSCHKKPLNWWTGYDGFTFKECKGCHVVLFKLMLLCTFDLALVAIHFIFLFTCVETVGTDDFLLIILFVRASRPDMALSAFRHYSPIRCTVSLAGQRL